MWVTCKSCDEHVLCVWTCSLSHVTSMCCVYGLAVWVTCKSCDRVYKSIAVWVTWMSCDELIRPCACVATLLAVLSLSFGSHLGLCTSKWWHLNKLNNTNGIPLISQRYCCVMAFSVLYLLVHGNITPGDLVFPVSCRFGHTGISRSFRLDDSFWTGTRETTLPRSSKSRFPPRTLWMASNLLLTKCYRLG